MPVRSGPTLPPSPEWVWHLAHCFWKTSLPRAASPPLRTIGASSSITFWRSGSGRPPPSREQRLGPPGDRRSGWAARACFWSRRELGELDLARLDRRRAAPRSSRPGRARRAGRPAGRRASAAPRRRPGSRPTPGRLAPADRLDQRRSPASGGVRGVTRASSSRAASGVRLAELDELPGGVDPGRRRASLVARPCARSVLGDLGRVPLEPLAPPAAGEPDAAAPLASGASFGSKRPSASSDRGVERRPACPSGQPRPGRRSTASATRRIGLGQRGQDRRRSSPTGPPRA